MPPSQKRKDVIRIAITAGKQPRRTPGNLTVLPIAQGRGTYVVLARAGSLTESGTYYYELTGEQQPTLAFDPNLSPLTRGTSSYITGRDGKPIKVRYLGADGAMKLTLAGKSFYNQAKQEYIVSVPVLVQGRRKNGQAYRREDYLPIDLVGISQVMISSNYPEEEKGAQVRSYVLRKLGERM